ncbi:hypothetical protein [Streptomyces chryseus]|uniref:Uncharacterized protein n=2 Tax=Streptomyces chryseus TaxID=68186 RepID=A0ABQ3DJB8_9ACTN|nr:hypothetical protein [Streptomyces chryseus]GHA94372.1 hypothetical protein GCM10010346_16420 [Streptomyces chryseus]
MSHLPRTIPAAALEGMTAALAAAGLELGPIKPGTRVTRTVQHAGACWELTYMGAKWGWRLVGPGVEHGIGVTDAEEAAAHIAAPPAVEPPARTVHVRIGTHRTAYHPDSACPALNGKPETYRGQEVMPEHQAQAHGLALCGQCDALLTTVPTTYAGVAVPALVRGAWTTPLGDGWRLGVRSTLAAS